MVNIGQLKGALWNTFAVIFDPNDIRDVIASGNVIGQTGTELALQPNYYVISLSGSGYAPPY